MKGVIDYAGLFPPASLALDPALRNYIRYREGEDGWMLSRFIIPYGRMEELVPYEGELYDTGRPLELSVLGGSTETVSEFEGESDELLSALDRFHGGHPGSVGTEILEVKLPREAVLAADAGDLKKIMDRLAERLGEDERYPDYVFYESVLEESWRKDLRAVMKALEEHNMESDYGRYEYAGFKLRCGGTRARMFPGTDQVAFALNRARRHRLALKCTAGLHHPVRHYSESVSTRMHGFFNVFGGAMLAWANDLDDGELESILKEEDPEQFRFGGEGLEWGEYGVTADDIAELREVALISYGSCSFDEPREDLRDLGLLGETEI